MKNSKREPKKPAISMHSDTYDAIATRARQQGMSISQTLDRLIVGALAVAKDKQ